jgi:hypothetical protein
MTPQPVTTERLDQFIANLNEMYRQHYAENGYTFEAPPIFITQTGSKNIKIVERRDGGRRDSGGVYCFIEKDTGNILKAASWKAPAKGARGSIWNDDCDVGVNKPCNVYGSGLYAR